MSAREEGWPLHVGAFFVGGAGSAHPSRDRRLPIGDRVDQVTYSRETVFPFRRVYVFEPPPVAMNQYPGTRFVYNNSQRCAFPGEETVEGHARRRPGAA
jgi:hypothetical protein